MRKKRRAHQDRPDDRERTRYDGRSITEAFVPWDTPGMAAALYVDDSFPKAVGLFGANPSSMGRVRTLRSRIANTAVEMQSALGAIRADL